MNFKENAFRVKQAKWSDAIKAVTKLNVYIDRELQVRIFLDINVNKEENSIEKRSGINIKETRDFIFISESDFNYFLFLIKRLFFSIANKYLVIELVKYMNDN